MWTWTTKHMSAWESWQSVTGPNAKHQLEGLAKDAFSTASMSMVAASSPTFTVHPLILFRSLYTLPVNKYSIAVALSIDCPAAFVAWTLSKHCQTRSAGLPTLPDLEALLPASLPDMPCDACETTVRYSACDTGCAKPLRNSAKFIASQVGLASTYSLLIRRRRSTAYNTA